MPEEKKSRYKGYTQVQNRATQKYVKAHLEDIKFRIRKGRKAYYKAAAEACGLSLAKFIITSMDEKIEREGVVISQEDAAVCPETKENEPDTGDA